MHKSGTRYMFTTEGHIVSVDKHLRESPWKELFSEEGGRGPAGKPAHRPKSHDVKVINSSSNVSCFHSSQEVRMWRERTHWQPITGPTRVGLAKSFPRPSRRWRQGVNATGAGAHCHSRLQEPAGTVVTGAGRQGWGGGRPPAGAASGSGLAGRSQLRTRLTLLLLPRRARGRGRGPVLESSRWPEQGAQVQVDPRAGGREAAPAPPQW